MTDATLQQIPIDAIEPSPHNPRRFRKDDAELASLAESIRAKGVLQPILVRPLPDPMGAGSTAFELIAGERRWRASKAADRETIPAIVREGLTDQEALELTVLENLQREDLSPLEEAAGVASLLAGGKPIAEVADQLGKPLSWVARRARLASLSPKWRALAGNAESQVSSWPASWLELVARIDPGAQDEFLAGHSVLISRDNWNTWDLGQLQRSLSEQTHELALAPWDARDVTLLPVVGACLSCPKRSSVNPGLFDEEEMVKGKRVAARDRCLDAVCWGRKADQHLEQIGAELVSKHPTLVIAVAGDKNKLPAFARGRSVVQSWEGNEGKKGDPGVVPVLYVDGQRRGALVWKKFASPSKVAKSRATAGEKPAPKPMAERRAQLEGRRQALAMEATIAALKKAKTPATGVLLRFLRAFGTDDNHSHPLHGGGSLGAPKNGLGLPQAKAEEFLWASVVKVIAARWDRTRKWNGTGGVVKLLPEIEAVCAMAGVDQAPFYAAAVKDLPEPKSWSTQPAAAKRKKTPPKKKARR